MTTASVVTERAAAIIARCREVAANPGPAVAAWRKLNPEGKVVAVFPTYVPEEIIRAAGMLPVGVMGGPIEISRADEHLQAFVCSIVRTSLEMALQGKFGRLDGFAVPFICDSVRSLVSILQWNLPDTKIDLFSPPLKLNSPASRTYLAAEFARFRTWCEGVAGRPISDEAILEQIAVHAAHRRLLGELYALRARGAVSLPLSDWLAVQRAGWYMPKEEHCQILHELLEDLSDSGVQISGAPSPRVIVMGVGCQLPPASILAAIAEAGVEVVDDDLFLGYRGLGAGSATNGSSSDPIALLTEQYLTGTPVATRHDPSQNRARILLEQAKRSGAGGVIFLYPKFCEPETFDYPWMRRTLSEAGIHTLYVEFEEHDASGAVSTRVQAFAEGLRR